MKKITLKIDGKKYIIIYDDVILHVYRIVNKQGAGALVFSSDETTKKCYQLHTRGKYGGCSVPHIHA